MKKLLCFTAFASLLASATPAFAIIDNNRTISRVGVQNSNSSAYVQFTVAPSATCSFNTLYIAVNTDAGRANYALLLTAQATGQPIVRVDYTVTGTTCTINLIEI